MNKRKKNLIIIFILIILITGILVIWMFNKNKLANQVPNDNPTAENPYKAIEKEKNLENNLTPLDKLVTHLPHQEGDFEVVSYDSLNNALVILIENDPYTNNQENAKNWLINQGIDLNSVKITWTALRGVGPNRPKDKITSPYYNPQDQD